MCCQYSFDSLCVTKCIFCNMVKIRVSVGRSLRSGDGMSAACKLLYAHFTLLFTLGLHDAQHFMLVGYIKPCDRNETETETLYR